ncbi:pentatricopeptide repeat-containing protein 2, mitochondrial [Puntigrus tetrazona]|uniref:pentatricopeptide repeat-containing protein 2, mitochondrial n=1 Tax=Puntigrus tetrazona TaxID=1606681 RepID=UPI001C8B0306|nr:pentatricopeptide repeat-containing protein 2, mitochondrial [Puntigrus tetrazona]
MALQRLNACSRALLTDLSRVAVLRGAIKSDCLKCRDGAKRYLLSEEVVKLQDFQQRKLTVAFQLSESKGYYFDEVNRKMEKKQLISKDELKILLYLCHSVEDVFMARNAMYRYHEENRNMKQFVEFKFGPLFMRLCYELGLEELGARTLTDPALKGFFLDSTSFNLAIDMLFTKQHYESCLEVVGEIKKQGVPFNKDTFMLAFAACYKLNTSKSYHICLTLLEEGQAKGSFIPRHAYCFAAALALKQNDIERAQAFYSQIMCTNSRLCQNLRVLILAMKGSMKEAVSVLTAALVLESPVFVKKPEFSQEVVNVLKNKSVGGLWEREVELVVKQLVEAGQITKQSIDDFLCHTASRRRMPQGILERERKTTRRNQRTLQSILLME